MQSAHSTALANCSITPLSRYIFGRIYNYFLRFVYGFLLPSRCGLEYDGSIPFRGVKIWSRCYKAKLLLMARFHLFISEIYGEYFCEYYPGLIGLVRRAFAIAPGELGSIPGYVIPKTWKMALDASLFNTQQYKLRIEGKVEKSRERSSGLTYTSV